MSSYGIYALDTWERVRADYQGGMTAAEVCRRHGVSRSQLYAQARAAGWRRVDQPEGDAGSAEPPPAPPTLELADLALRRAADAITRGRLEEARGWARLVAQVRELGMGETGAETWPRAVARLKARAADADTAAAGAGASPIAPPSPAPEAGLPAPAGPPSPVAAEAQIVTQQGAAPTPPDRPVETEAAPESGAAPSPATASTAVSAAAPEPGPEPGPEPRLDPDPAFAAEPPAEPGAGAEAIRAGARLAPAPAPEPGEDDLMVWRRRCEQSLALHPGDRGLLDTLKAIDACLRAEMATGLRGRDGRLAAAE